MNNHTVIFRHHRAGQPRPSYRRKGINPLPTTSWTFAGLPMFATLCRVIEARAKAINAAAMQIKPKRMH